MHNDRFFDLFSDRPSAGIGRVQPVAAAGRRGWRWLLPGLLMLAGVTVCGVVAQASCLCPSPRWQDAGVTQPWVLVSTPRRPPKPRPNPKKPAKEESEPEPEPQPDAKPPSKAQPDSSQPGDAQKRSAFKQAVKDTRLAMSTRDLSAARRHLKTVKGNIQNQADQDQFERLDIMLENLTEFWSGVRGAVARLQPTNEIDLKDNRVSVVAASQEELVVHIYGRTQRYRIEALPLKLLVAIADQAFLPTPGSKVIVGTFLAIDREGANRAQAKKLWQQAAKDGQDLAKQLLPELDVPLPEGDVKRR
jgi:hypothetical protein